MEKQSQQRRDAKEFKTEQSPSPTIQNILDGKAKIVYSSDTLESREVLGKKWFGHSYTYECIVSHPTKPNEEWTTWLTVWRPSSIEKDRFVELPKTQVTILTGQGETSLSSNQEVIDKVYDEISRQVSGRG